MILIGKGSYFIEMLRSKVMEYVKNIRMSHIPVSSGSAKFVLMCSIGI